MKRKLLNVCLISALLSFGSCDETDLSGLQDQIDGLTEQVGEMEKAQQDALLEQIAALQALITDLQADNDELSTDYTLLLEKLQALQADVEAGVGEIHYGNVLTDTDFAAVLETGASIITGKVSVTTQAHITALANVKLVGGYLEIKGGADVNFPNLENVGGDLMLAEINEEAEVVLPKLASVGGNFTILANEALLSVSANELVMIYGLLELKNNTVLASLSMANLDVVGELYMNGEVVLNPEWGSKGKGPLVDINLSQTKVIGDVHLSYLGDGAKISLGELGANFVCTHTGVDTLMLTTTTIPGDLTIDYNQSIAELSFENLTSVEGNISINYNVKSGGMGGAVEGGLTSLTAFDNLLTIGGDLDVNGNGAITELIAFNNVTEIKGDKITFQYNGSEKTQVSIFSKLTTASSGTFSFTNIMIAEKTDWFDGFNALEKAGDIFIEPQLTMNAAWELGEVCRFDGFDALLEANFLDIRLKEITEFGAFSSLDNLKKNGEYLVLYMPKDETVGLCSMGPFLSKIKAGDLDNQWNENVKAKFMDSMTWSEVEDRDVAIARLVSSCEN